FDRGRALTFAPSATNFVGRFVGDRKGMRGIYRLSARTAAATKAVGLHADGGGLDLQVTRSATCGIRRSWVVRYTAPDGRRREMGLGALPYVELSQARELALAARKRAKAGADPIAERQEKRAAEIARHAKAMTFRQCAEAYTASNSVRWKNAKHRWQWTNS